MGDTYQYRLSNDQKREIAQNLIDILEKDVTILTQTKMFISNWILTDAGEKRKAFFDVWDIVLKNFLPTIRPILFRACDRVSKNKKVASFTGRLECAKGFSNGKGYLIICDTKETLAFENKLYKPGEYRNTFYPLVNVLEKARVNGGWGFSERLLNDYKGEDEYIMRVNLSHMHSVKWIKNKF